MAMRVLNHRIILASLPLLLLGNTYPNALGLPDSCGSVQSANGFTAGEIVLEKVRDSWSMGGYPNVIAFSVNVHGILRSKAVDAEYRGEQDIGSGALRVSRFSSEEIADPYVPTGINLGFGVTLNGRPAYGKVYSNAPTRDILGAPHLSPLYSFGVNRTLRILSQASSASNSPLFQIGGVAVTARSYEIACAFEPAPGSDGVYHLQLRPLADPGKHRLREMWVDADSFVLQRLRTAGNFSSGPPTKVDWLVTFQVIHGAVYIDRETALSNLNYGEGKIYDDVYIEFTNVVAQTKPSLMTLVPQVEDADDLHEP